MTSEFPYYANATLDDGTEVEKIDLEERGWADKAMLSRTVRWSLVPKGTHITLTGRPWPLVSIAVPEGAKPVFRSRVMNSILMTLSEEDKKAPEGMRFKEARLRVPAIRVYCIGWKRGSEHVWAWVLPTGDIEVGVTDDSHLALHLRAELDKLIDIEFEPIPEDENADSSPAQ